MCENIPIKVTFFIRLKPRIAVSSIIEGWANCNPLHCSVRPARASKTIIKKTLALESILNSFDFRRCSPLIIK